MNINIFFIFISSALLMILLLFKPMDIKEQKYQDVPVFNIAFFTIYELSTSGLTTFISGSEATRYTDRYTIKDMDYTDNSKTYLANMKADRGIFKDDIVNLTGDVVYFREDGLTFQTQEATYNTKTSIAKANLGFILTRDKNRATGTHLVYNNLLNTINAKKIKVTYQLPKSKK